ncbi:hypothetical protein SAMN04515647_4269 [Cohaesibacter sp. ES.047]|uniref:hypothetical protein n=1 Tax=Cohaesibacter sp. ES.047 TaxID=1798205 RepID=UPI000BBFEB3A|nr:hypothetical protein [Cohaesibacter sp. ES.047]SNY93947.1 hypothetical protein SAMN04515647_4269 [Cohaesibacter sp. ES.047]
MQKQILALSLMAFSGLLTGCKTVPVDTLCEARLVRVTPALKTEFKSWLKASGRLRPDAPDGAGPFLKDLRVNNDLIRQRCGR